MLRCLLILTLTLLAIGVRAESHYELDGPPHDYWKRPLNDPFTKLKADFESGKLQLDTTSEKTTLLSLLKIVGIPASSQMLVFSTTSLQLRLISPRNPRALFFNEDLYIGFIPGGRIEVVSLDPEVGGIFYIFDMPRGGGRFPNVERSTKCMNCHSREDSLFVPGLIAKSVFPGQLGGSLDAFRQGQSGHGIPYANRFGGWYLTGKHGITQSWANIMGRTVDGKQVKVPLEPGRYFDYARYPMASSDILPQLIHEHQIGFANRTIDAAYAARQVLSVNNAKPDPAQLATLDAKARALPRYLLFADEPALPAGGVEGDAAFKTDFLATKRALPSGPSLKDFDLKTRMFRFRCSYMIYSTVFQGLPAAIKERVYRRLGEALDLKKPDAEYAYLPAAEKQAIHAILKGTLKDLPANW